MLKNKERQDKLAADKDKPTEQKMGSKEITMMILESLLETNKVQNDIAMFMAKAVEKEAVKDSLSLTPDSSSRSADWAVQGFESLIPKK